MKVLYVPQRNDDDLRYQFEGDVITAHHNEETDVFDFTGMPDGKLDEIESTLSIGSPIVDVTKENGELFVKLLYYHGKDASEAERFPEWMDVADLKVGVYDGEN